MKKLIIYSALVLTMAGVACKKILDKVDFNGVPTATAWGNQSTALLYLDNLYQLCMPVFYSAASSGTIPTAWHNISDECNGGSTIGVLQGNLTQESETDWFPTANSYWAYIRKINILFDQIEKYGLTPDFTGPVKAQAYFLRAWSYFQLVKVYGGVPYITKNLDWTTDTLNLPRMSTTACVDSMIADLNHCSILPTTWPSAADQGRITSIAALALKGRILLYYASPQFNPNNDGSRWQAAYAANEAAYDSAIAAGYALYSNYSRIFLDASTATDKEPILYRAYNASTSISQNSNNWETAVRPYSMNYSGGGKSYNPTWNLVSAYPMADGHQPRDPNGKYTYDSVRFWQNRDPRFYSSIVYNGAVYGLGSTAGRVQFTYLGTPEEINGPTTTGFYTRRNVDTTLTLVGSQYNKTWWVEMRLAEVMLNLAECANATGNQAEAYTMLEAIRKRAGIPAGTGSYYGLTQGLSQTDLQAAIMNERRIEFAFEDKRYDDLRRTRTFDALNGQYRLAHYLVPRSPWFSSTKVSDTGKVNNIERHIPGSNVTKIRDTVNINGPAFAVFFKDSVAPITNEQKINFQTSYYFYGIPSSDIGKQPALQQTIGWLYNNIAGTFDPTK
ncbi:MAG TPA: RagB/SusD family nutrient uptake outer membrane protein [Puia sp.]|nr:RagB/SusD family nutrient uptake outer membrane protein [Puia sp.]